MKKILLTVSALILCAAFLTACSALNSKGAQTAASASPGTSAATSADVTENSDITVVNGSNEAISDGSAPAVTAAGDSTPAKAGNYTNVVRVIAITGQQIDYQIMSSSTNDKITKNEKFSVSKYSVSDKDGLMNFTGKDQSLVLIVRGGIWTSTAISNIKTGDYLYIGNISST